MKSRRMYFVATAVLCGFGVLGTVVYQNIYQRFLDQALLRAIRGCNEESAINALNKGANANAVACDDTSVFSWKRLFNILTHRSGHATDKPVQSALIMAIDWRWRESETVPWGASSGYAPANAPPEMYRVVAGLLSKGARLDVCNEVGLDPLQLASWQGKSRIVELLLQHGASVNQMGKCKYYANGTALMFAIAANSEPCVRGLAEYGADIDTIRGADGYTSLQLASENPRIEAILKDTLKRRHSSPKNSDTRKLDK